jgi:pimeloyl-ACP methyl ester carboxylesterase
MKIEEENLVIEDYHGHKLYRFDFCGSEAIIVEPVTPLKGKPYIWKAFYFDAFPKFELAMLDQGYYLVHIKSPTLFPIPETMKLWDEFYQLLTQKYGFPDKAMLFGLSRGGMFLYSWAMHNPDKVSCVYADNPACDYKSVYYQPHMMDKFKQLVEAYGFKSDEEALTDTKFNPIDNLKPLADAGVHIIHVAAVDDQIVPFDENTAKLEKLYKELGGHIEVIAHPGKHHPHGLEDPTPIINLINKYYVAN